MRAFTCPACGARVFFENSRCLACGTALAFDWDARSLVALAAPLRRCATADVAACNWAVRREGDRCTSCALTRTRPADADPAGLAQLAEAEAAKRRLLFELGELGLFRGRPDPEHPLVFDLLSSEPHPVATGHADGVITLDLAEADDAHRALMRQQLREPYRTVLGHFRHEIGHYYWPVLVAGKADLAACRARFGDEREDYGAALERHYRDGPPDDWPERTVSAYATMHPWEDWAETFAQLLHIRDALQTAAAFGLRVDGGAVPSADVPIEDAVAPWLSLSAALNAMNRSLGQDDLYPYVLTPAVIGKLAFVDGLVRRRYPAGFTDATNPRTSAAGSA